MTYKNQPGCLRRSMTGLYGCVWNKQNEKEKTSWGQVFWFCLMFYIWWEAATFLHWSIAMKNDSADIDRGLSALFGLGSFNFWYNLIRVFSVVTFVYMTIATFLGLLHLYAREPLYMSVWHRVLVIVCILVIYTLEIIVVYTRPQEIKLLLISLDVSGPYLHVFMVMFLAVLTWPIAWYWLRWQIGFSRIYLLLVYIAALVLLYVWPIVIRTPLIISKSDMPGSKPRLIAYGGMPCVAPENTLLSFKLAREYNPVGYHLDVWVSRDGVPFVARDSTLGRTTNTTDSSKHTADYTRAELENLDAGTWFLKTDPYHMVAEMTSVRREEISRQRVPTLAEALDEIGTATVFIQPMKEGLKRDHPFYDSYDERILSVVNNSDGGIAWLGEPPSGLADNDGSLTFATNFTDNMEVLAQTFAGVSVPYWKIGYNQIKQLTEKTFLVNIESVNSEWLYTIYWTQGASIVTTECLPTLSDIKEPHYILHPGSYLITWIVADSVSALLVLVFWFFNYMIYQNEEARKETLLMDDVTETVSYTNEEPDLNFGTPPVPAVGSGLEKKPLPYDKSEVGFD